MLEKVKHMGQGSKPGGRPPRHPRSLHSSRGGMKRTVLEQEEKSPRAGRKEPKKYFILNSLIVLPKFLEF